jgi:predicted ester cyclase
LHALLAPDFINRTPDLSVEIHDQIAEGDSVTTRKTIHGTHRGALYGVPPTNLPVAKIDPPPRP